MRAPRADGQTYAAFISYNHNDAALAEALERAMERFATPFYRRRRLSVFRDASSMTVADDLWSAITHPMAQAEFVVFLSSVHSVGAPWVDRELAHCIETKGLDHLVPVVLDGTWMWDRSAGRLSAAPEALVPGILQTAYEAEPLYVDLRGVTLSGTALRKDPRFRSAVARIVSRVRDVDLETLIGDEVRQRRRTIGLGVVAGAVVTALAVLATVLAIAATSAKQSAVRNKNEAVAARDDATRNRDLAQQNERRAVEAKAAAEAEARRSLALALASSSQNQGPLDRPLALALAAQAHATMASPVTSGALYRALSRESRVTGRFDPALASGDGPLDGYTLSPDGSVAAVARVVNGAQGDDITFVDVAHGLTVIGSVFAGGSPSVVFAPGGRRAVISAVPPCCILHQLPDGRQATIVTAVTRVEIPTRAPDEAVGLTRTPPIEFASDRAVLTVSPDGRFALRTTAVGSVSLIDFDAMTSRDVDLGEARPTAQTISPDGATAAIALGGDLVLFALSEPGAQLRVPVLADLPSPSALPVARSVSGLEFSPDSTALALAVSTAGSADLTIGLHRLLAGQTRWRGRSVPGDPARNSELAFSSDGAWLAGSGADTVLFHTTDDDFGRLLPGRFGGFDRSGARLVTSGPAGSTTVWSTAADSTGGLPLDVRAGEAGSASNGTTSAAVFGLDATGRPQMVTSGARLTTWTDGIGPPLLGALLPARELVMSGLVNAGKTIVGTGTGPTAGSGRAAGVPVAPDGQPGELAPAASDRRRTPSPGDVIVVDNAPDVGAVSAGSAALIFDPARASPYARIDLPRPPFTALAFRATAPDRTLLATESRLTVITEAGQDERAKRLVVYDLTSSPATALEVRPLADGSDVVVAFSADSRMLFVADHHTLRAVVVRGEVGRSVNLFEYPVDITALAVAPSGALAYGTANGEVRLVPPGDISQLIERATPAAPTTPAPGPSSARSAAVASTTSPASVTTSPGEVAPGHRAKVTGIWLDPSGMSLVSQDIGGSVEVSDAATLVAMFEIADTTPGLGLVIADHDLFMQAPQGIERWDLSVETLETRGCAANARGLTEPEQRRYLDDARSVPLRCA